MRQTHLRPLFAAGALACGTILALAAPSSAADTHPSAKPAHRRSGPQRIAPGTNSGSLSHRLSRSGGVLHPPPFSGNSTPVIPPPGTPGGNPHIQPK
ncbi:MAG TPA: hypothetical protein VE993_05715 [Stellaceae bacterium]|nr:hypothetical protein [Stellaceae bacterium]